MLNFSPFHSMLFKINKLFLRNCQRTLKPICRELRTSGREHKKKRKCAKSKEKLFAMISAIVFAVKKTQLESFSPFSFILTQLIGIRRKNK